MIWLPYAASAALGIIVGWLIWTFVHRAKTLTVKAVTSLATLAAGGVVIAAAAWKADGGAADAVYLYPIGALLSIMFLGALQTDPETGARKVAGQGGCDGVDLDGAEAGARAGRAADRDAL